MDQPFYQVAPEVLMSLLTNEEMDPAERLARWAILSLHRMNSDCRCLGREQIVERTMILNEILMLSIEDVENGVV